MPLPPHLDVRFEPDAARSRRLDARMRARLGDSLRYVIERAADALPPPSGWQAFLARLDAGPVDPQAFGAYYELVLAIDDGDLEQAAQLLAVIASAPARASGITLRSLADPDGCPVSRRYARLVDTDVRWPLRIAPPDPAVAEVARRGVLEALAFLERVHPALAGELEALLAEIVLARSEGSTEYDFDGVSSFMLWGGLVLNAGSHETLLERVEVLAHESGHNLLFGFASDGPLLENDDEARFPSPLRSDPRPLDGIYHATYVTARMHHVLRHLLEASALAPDDRRSAEAKLEVHAKNFADGLQVLERHARLTPVGEAALGAAVAYMRSP